MTTWHRLFGILSGLVLLLVMDFVYVAAQSDPKGSASSKASSRTDSPALLQVIGEVSHPLALSAADLAKFKHQTVRAKRHDGIESQYEGVRLVDILAKAGVPVGSDLRGSAMALYLVVEASDGYRAAFALAELDPAFTDRVILLADRRDGQPLSARDGPLQIVVPGEKKHARWVRQAIKLKVGQG
jgi:DMSO/TMAO reductase YedYZ molybdopterin-dependent catalytic subunit